MKKRIEDTVNDVRSDAELIHDLLESKIDPEEDIKENQVVLEVVQNNEYFPVFTLGNFSAIIGKAKARKSFFVSMILGTMARQKAYMNLMPRIKGMCILFDTEQGKYHCNQFAKRAMKISESDQHFMVFSLRRFDTEHRIQLIEKAIYMHKEIKFVIIDGVRDLVTDINNPDQATRISNLLLKWSDERQIHIMCVIHQNKADVNARGHIGTEVVNKSETVLSIEKDKNDAKISKIGPEFMRGLHFEPFEIKIEDGIPVYAGELEDKIPF